MKIIFISLFFGLAGCMQLPIVVTRVENFREADTHCRAVNRDISTRLNADMWITACVWRWQSQCHVIASPACGTKCRVVLDAETKSCSRGYEDGRKTAIGVARIPERSI